MFGLRTGLFEGKSFRSRVISAINKKIDDVEKDLKFKHKRLQQEHDKKVDLLHAELHTDKELATEEAVVGILSKII